MHITLTGRSIRAIVRRRLFKCRHMCDFIIAESVILAEMTNAEVCWFVTRCYLKHPNMNTLSCW